MRNDTGGQVVRERIDEILQGETKPGTAARSKALAGVQWFLATQDGRAVGLKGTTSKLVPLEEAQIYDGRDNEDMKRRFFEVLLKMPLMIVPVKEDAP